MNVDKTGILLDYFILYHGVKYFIMYIETSFIRSWLSLLNE